MHIGLLQCDDLAPHLRDKHGNYPELYAELLRSVDPTLTFETWRAHDGELPDRIDGCDGWLISGSKAGIYEDLDWIPGLLQLIRRLWEARAPVVGICFGHQALAHAMGAEVGKSDRGWGVGVAFNEVLAHQSWMTPWQEGLDLIISHQDQVLTLPENSELLAENGFCPYFMIQYGTCFLSLQGHPEFSRTLSADLMAGKSGSMPDSRRRQGMASLTADTDERVMARWMVNFLRDAAGFV
ncbi:GMP synthase-like glutamine amidotransferase [Kushneria sinocarnis]|uniref:GMP synthase-like glutamine amidotransferase n=1 Tax=Kushneria sinocarnis TaxID=595502 RepID=A0A420X029_9GAMM|nr:GMP synthase [Kushneria sinocarnis]RKR06860.1 GMP synthase-like glutamine amidotransferase [Kushneria sinocarnis]